MIKILGKNLEFFRLNLQHKVLTCSVFKNFDKPHPQNEEFSENFMGGGEPETLNWNDLTIQKNTQDKISILKTENQIVSVKGCK